MGGAAQAAMTTTNQSDATAQSALSSTRAQKNTLVVGSEQDYPPFATGMADATAGGFTVDLWKAVAAEAGLNYTIRVRPFHQILQEFKEGKIDVLINLAKSEERQHFADFTVPHVVVNGAIFVRKGESGIRTEGDFTGKSIIVLNADLAHDYAVSKGWEKQLVLVGTSAEGMRLLASGKHDAMLLSKLAGMQTLQLLGLTNIEALKVKAGFSQKFAFAVQEGQSELLGRLNEGLALTKSNGTYNDLYDKWFGVYEVKEVGLRDMLKYIIPIVAAFLVIAGYFFYRRQVERAEAEKKYRDLYDHAPDMFMSCEAKTANILDCNRTLLDATGYSREELVGCPAFELYHPDCADLARIAFQKFMDNKEVYGVELQLRCKDGSKIDVSLNASAVCDEHGAILHSRSALRDITERKQAEEMLRKLFIAVEQSTASVVITDLEARIQYVNPGFIEITGYSAAEAIGQNPRILQSGQTPSETYLELWGKLISGQAWHGELLNKRKNGELYWENVHIAPVRNPAGIVTHYVAVKTDITERKRIEHALVESESRFHEIFNAVSDAIFIHDAETGRIVDVNHRMCKMYGLTREQALACGPDDLSDGTPPYSSTEVIEKIRLARTEGPQTFDWLARTHDGHIFWVEVSLRLALIGSQQRILAVVRDISGRKEFEEELKRSNAELEQFSYAVSHDMRQPLRMISSYLQLLEMGLVDQLDSEKRGYFDFAIEGAKRIDQMLVALLEYSRVGKMGEPPTWIDSRAVLDEALQFLQPAIAEARARVNISGEWPRILASHDEMLRLLQNLIGNAAKYRIAGRIPEITLTSQMVKNEWHLCVADNGVGIIPDQIKRLFQVFQRLQSREIYEGTGIGLALCRKIAEHHKGRIWAESAGEGLGSQFYVALPVLREKT